jgi:hypothetical protein
MTAGRMIASLLSLVVAGHACASNDEQLQVGGADIVVEFNPPAAPGLHNLVLDWVTKSAKAVTTYYKKFPVSAVHIHILLYDGRGTRSGHTNGWNGSSIRIAVGTKSSASDFAKDWIMTHEMVHLAFPSVATAHHWIEEGQATYIEPVARARAGDLTPEKVWGDLMDGLPNGLPGPQDRGLDFTPTWGRTYWGGALFCLLADIEIRKRTENRRGLEDALRAVLAAGGTIEAEWPLTKALRIGDDATGVPVLSELYEKMKASPFPVDLAALWKELGVAKKDGLIRFNDSAPLATIRRTITATTPHTSLTGQENNRDRLQMQQGPKSSY